MFSNILDLDTQTNQYFYDSGYSDAPSPGASSTSSNMLFSSTSNSSEDIVPNTLRYLNISDQMNPHFEYEPYKLNQTQPNIMIRGEPPVLVIKEQPVDKFRFRYKSEMHGTHGSLMGENNEKSKRTYPTVELKNYNKKALIQCSLYQATNGIKCLPHSHKLVVRNGDEDKCDPHELLVSPEAGYIAVFQGMGIIHTAKKFIAEELITKKLKQRRFELGRPLTTREESQIKITAEKEAKDINLNQVCLAFHAYAMNDDGTLSKLCDPVFSRPINNMKSALTGELKIVRLSSVVSSASGGEDVFLLVEKVGKKNIRVRFFETDDEDNTVWEDWGNFSESDVHHQYAIALRTPPYKDRDITSDVEVFIQLERPSDCVRSEPLPFKYKPRDLISRKRARMSSSCLNSYELPVVINVTNKNQPLSISEEFNKSQELMKLLSGSDEVPDEYLNQVQMDSDELMNIVGAGLLDSSDIDKLRLDGTADINHKPFMKPLPKPIEKKLSKRRTTGEENKSNDWYLEYFQKILRVFRQRTNIQQTKIEIANIFKEASVNDDGLLHCAIRNGNSIIVTKLLKWIDQLQIPEVLQLTNENNETCLHIACLFDRPEYIGALIQLGVDPNIRNIDGNTALHLAIEENFTLCAAKIIEKSNYTEKSHQLNIDFTNDNALTPLHLAIRKRNFPLVKKIIEDGKASLKLCTKKDENNALHLAVQEKDEQIVKYLLESTNVKINQENLSGVTPLKLASKMGPEAKNIVQLLCKRGAIMSQNSLNTNKNSKSSLSLGIDSTEDSSSSDDDDSEDSQSVIDVKYGKDRLMIDKICIKQLSSIFNHEDKWISFAKLLGLSSHVCLWMSCDNSTEKMLNFINNGQFKKLTIGEMIAACEELHEKDAVKCLEEMKKRQNP